MARRAVEIGAVIAAAMERGYRCHLGTFTVRHLASDPLARVWDAVATAWRAVISGKAWLTLKKRAAIAGWVRVVEVTHGLHGWHVHIHVLIISKGDLSAEWPALRARWARGAARAGMRAVDDAQDLRVVTGPADDALSAYFTKSVFAAEGLAREMTGSMDKQGRRGGRTPWQLLSDAMDDDTTAASLWRRWETGSWGRRQIGWSLGLRDLFALGEAESDEDIAQKEAGTPDDDVLFITASGWRRLADLDKIADVLTVTERQGLPGLKTFLGRLAVNFVPLD